MSDVHAGSGAAPVAHPSAAEDFDRELDIRGILWATAGVIVITLISVVAMWGLLEGLNVFERHNAEPAPPMMTAHPEGQAPEPRLQAAPPADMTAMHADEDRMLQHAGWVDKAQGTVRLPIDLAIDVLAQRGLPAVTTPSLATMTREGSTAGNGRPPTDQPSPGTLLPPPGFGIGMIGPPSAGAGQVLDPATMDSMSAPPAAAKAPGAAAAPTAAATAKPAPARKPAVPALPATPPPGGRP